MNLIDRLEHTGQAYELGVCDEAAAMLRKQDAAIRQLREALKSIKRMSYDGSAQERTCNAALAATEEFQK
jgi:hypothetical protein